MSNKAKNKNPLFVVTNEGQDVEAASGFFDAFVKRFGLGPALEVLKQIMQMITEAFPGYTSVIILKEFLDEILSQVLILQEKIEEKLGPYSEMAARRLEAIFGKVPRFN